MTMLKPFIAGHEELIHDLNYDFYGKRIATCSSDQHIKVFDKVEDYQNQNFLTNIPQSNDTSNTAEKPDWTLSDSWKAHESTIVKVVWAGPEFGQVIASCSYDATVRVWEEDPREEPGSGRRWKQVCTISDFRGPVYDIAFAPSHLGLRLASIDSEGIFRVHEAPDPNNLKYWSPTMAEESLVSKQASKSRQSAFSLSWCPSMFFKEFIAISAQNSAFIYHKAPDSGRFKKVAVLQDGGSMIRSISWAPSMGRGFQLIAAGSNDGQIGIYKVTRAEDNANGSNGVAVNRLDLNSLGDIGRGSFESTSTTPDNINFDFTNQQDDLADNKPQNQQQRIVNVESSNFQGHDSEVWRVSWNVTGTILSTAGSDGNIKFWKSAFTDKFQLMAVLSAEQRNNDINAY